MIICCINLVWRCLPFSFPIAPAPPPFQICVYCIWFFVLKTKPFPSLKLLWINLIPLKSIFVPICYFSVLLLGLTSWTKQIWLYCNEVIFKHFWHKLHITRLIEYYISQNSINSRFIYCIGPRLYLSKSTNLSVKLIANRFEFIIIFFLLSAFDW